MADEGRRGGEEGADIIVKISCSVQIICPLHMYVRGIIKITQYDNFELIRCQCWNQDDLTRTATY